MNAKGVAYIVAAIVLGVFVLANWILFAAPVELNFLIARVHAPLIILVLLVAGLILLIDLGIHAVNQRAWVRERRALVKDLEGARLRADHEEESRTGALRVAMERELAAIRAQLEQLVASQSALLGRPPITRPVEPELIPPRAAIEGAHAGRAEKITWRQSALPPALRHLLACIRRDPVHFPGLAAIIRESLFKAARSRRDVRDDKAHKDGPAVERFLVEKLAASILELTDRGWAQGTASAVGEIEAPLAGFGIV